MNMKTARYWMVHGFGSTSIKHTTADSAIKEACRLAKQHIGQTFHVLAVVGAYQAEANLYTLSIENENEFRQT
jgi:hypothetical protein